MMLTPATLQDRLAQYSPYINEFLRDRLLFTPPSEGAIVIPAKDYFTPEYLQPSLEAFAQISQIPNLTVATSLWNKNYNNALIPAILTPMTLLGVGLNVSIENISLVLQEETPEAIILHDLEGSVIYPPRFGQQSVTNCFTISELSQLHELVFQSLFSHLRFLIKPVNALTRLPRSVMWGNVGNICNFLYEELANCPDMKTATETDRRTIFEQRHDLGNSKRNPLYQAITQQSHPNFTEPIIIRQVCCLLFKKPNSNYCGNCPLMTPEERLARLNT
jgi:ferric iron reductase protein FhuF